MYAKPAIEERIVNEYVVDYKAKGKEVNERVCG